MTFIFIVFISTRNPGLVMFLISLVMFLARVERLLTNLKFEVGQVPDNPIN